MVRIGVVTSVGHVTQRSRDQTCDCAGHVGGAGAGDQVTGIDT